MKRHSLARLSDAETEAVETQVWLEFAVKCGYLSKEEGRAIYQTYDAIIANHCWNDNTSRQMGTETLTRTSPLTHSGLTSALPESP